MKLLEVYPRLQVIERHFRAAHGAVAHFLAACQSDPTHSDRCGLRVSDVRDCTTDLEDTYLVRAYAVFEIALRDYWQTGVRRRTHPQTEQLIDRVAARRFVLDDERREVHAVRLYRNYLVHGGESPLKIDLDQAKRRMCRFLRRLPPSW